jgi:hypothetical protein
MSTFELDPSTQSYLSVLNKQIQDWQSKIDKSQNDEDSFNFALARTKVEDELFKFNQMITKAKAVVSTKSVIPDLQKQYEECAAKARTAAEGSDEQFQLTCRCSELNAEIERVNEEETQRAIKISLEQAKTCMAVAVNTSSGLETKVQEAAVDTVQNNGVVKLPGRDPATNKCFMLSGADLDDLETLRTRLPMVQAFLSHHNMFDSTNPEHVAMAEEIAEHYNATITVWIGRRTDTGKSRFNDHYVRYGHGPRSISVLNFNVHFERIQDGFTLSAKYVEAYKAFTASTRNAF